MESKDIYKQSYDELVRIKKSTTGSIVTINVDKLDASTKNEMLQAIVQTASRRQSAILNVIGNINRGIV
jgi:hypothetical protein